FQKGRDEDGRKRCERLLELETAWPADGDGTARPRDEDLLDLAELCRLRGKPTAAVRYYIEAARARVLKPGMKEVHRAAQAAALAGCAGEVSELEQKVYRDRALEWLRGELTALMKSLTNEGAPVAHAVQGNLARWQREKAFAGVRDADMLRNIPEAERRRWESFWGEGEAVRQLARSQTRWPFPGVRRRASPGPSSPRPRSAACRGGWGRWSRASGSGSP